MIAGPTTGPHLTFSTDDPGGVRLRSSWPHSHQQGAQGVHRNLLSPGSGSPCCCSISPRTVGRGLGAVSAEEPSHDLASRPPGSQPSVWEFLEPVLSKVLPGA